MARFPRWRRCSRQHLPRGTARTRSWSGWRPRLGRELDRKSTRLNSSHERISYAVFCLKKKKNADEQLAKKGSGKGGKTSFGNDNYFVAIFGKPSVTEPWMVQCGRHPLRLTVKVVQMNC